MNAVKMLSDNFRASLGNTYKLAHIMFKPSLLRYITLQNFIGKSPV